MIASATPDVLTLTLNPAIDQTITLDSPLQAGTVHRARSVSQHAGGKGINVALALSLHGTPVAAGGLLGSNNAAQFEQFFRQHGIHDRFIRTAGASRINLKLLDSQHTSDINLPDQLQIQPEHIQQVLDTRSFPSWLALCGSLPTNCPDDWYVRCLHAAAPHTRCVLDTSGTPLRAALHAVQQKMAPPPFAIKPNVHELSDYLGQPLEGLPAIHQAALALQRATHIVWVVVSMGSEGVLLSHQSQGALHAHIPINAISQTTVGAGDFMVAALLAAFMRNADLETTARMACAFSAWRLTTSPQDWHRHALQTTLPHWMEQTRCIPLE